MLYIEYERLKRKYQESLTVYENILTEKEAIFQKTQPKAVDTESERVTSTPSSNVFDCYLIEKERKNIDARLAEAKAICDDRKNLMERKEEELRKCKRIEDTLYVMRNLDRMRIKRIAKELNYSESQIYRVLQNIRFQIEHDRKCEKQV